MLGAKVIPKRINKFLMVEQLVVNIDIISTWIGEAGPFDHVPIFLQVGDITPKTTCPFKLNSHWLKELEFKDLL